MAEGADVNKAGGFFFGYPLSVLRNKQKSAFIGWAAINTYDPPEGAEWGTFNDRIIEQPWVRDLLKKYTTDVFDNMADETAMEIVLSESWIQNPLGDLVKSVDEIIEKDTVPKLRFTAAGLEEMKEERLWMMGGNHRRLAQRIMLDQKTGDYERMMEDAKELRDKWAEGGKVDERKRKEAEELEADAEELKKQIDFESLWAVKLYSRGEQRQGGSPRGEETR